MIIRARSIATMDGPPIENGGVVISGDRIVDIGEFSEVSKRHSTEEVVDLGEQALLPGLINTHCHLDYTCLRGKISRQESFADWIRAINFEKAKLSPEDYVASIKEGFAEAKRFGTTTIANLTAFPELVSPIEPPIRTWWFAELIDVRNPVRAAQNSTALSSQVAGTGAQEPLDLAIQSLKSKENWGLAPHAPYTASANLYRRCQEIARRENILLTTHLAESREEMSMFRDASGRLYQFLKEVGREMSDCGHETPLVWFSEILRDSSRLRENATARQATSLGMTEGWMVVHLNELTERDFDLLKRSGTKLQIVHCPRSHAYFGHSKFQFEKLRKLGFNICLGTDSLASNEDLSLFAEMRAFQKTFPDVSSEEILKMVTTNPARALRQENSIGKIRSGFVADLIAMPCKGSTSLFEEIIAFDQAVAWSMVSGRVLA